jgi:hypothetical protein
MCAEQIKSCILNLPIGISWVQHVISQFDGGMRYEELPAKPHELSSWDSGMIRDAIRGKSSSNQVQLWRSWIRGVESTEARNQASLCALFTALRIAKRENADDYVQLIQAFLLDEWNVTERETEEYLVTHNPVLWIRNKTRDGRSPDVRERDPGRCDPERE